MGQAASTQNKTLAFSERLRGRDRCHGGEKQFINCDEIPLFNSTGQHSQAILKLWWQYPMLWKIDDILTGKGSLGDIDLSKLDLPPSPIVWTHLWLIGNLSMIDKALEQYQVPTAPLVLDYNGILSLCHSLITLRYRPPLGKKCSLILDLLWEPLTSKQCSATRKKRRRILRNGL